jgi:putative nucleotidyltransferase with HDIG domain
VDAAVKRILFVDDDVNVLDGLRNVLRKQRRVWEMVFAVGGTAALEEMKGGPFDVVVSDMRMPGMDGAGLLQIVKDTYPGTARIVLSGHAERDAVMRALPVAHQYLSKPCDVDQLTAVIERTCALQAILHSEAIRAMVSHLDALPLAPRTYWQITQAAGNEDASLAEIGTIVEQDPALVAKVLQLVNSAYFGLAQQITSATLAVQYLGLELIKGLALAEHMFTLTVPENAGLSLEDQRQHSLLTARLAKTIANDTKRAEDVFTAAMVHDVGKLILACGRPALYARVVQLSKDRSRQCHLLEQNAFGASHAEVGAYLLGVWGLPLPIVEAVAFHHEPERAATADRRVVASVHAADVVVDGICGGDDDSAITARLDVAFLASAGITPDVAGWRAFVTAGGAGDTPFAGR